MNAGGLQCGKFIFIVPKLFFSKKALNFVNVYISHTCWQTYANTEIKTSNQKLLICQPADTIYTGNTLDIKKKNFFLTLYKHSYHKKSNISFRLYIFTMVTLTRLRAFTHLVWPKLHSDTV